MPSTVAGTVREVQGQAGRQGQGRPGRADARRGAGAKRPPNRRDTRRREGGRRAAPKPKPQPAGAPEEGGLSQAAPGAAKAGPCRGPAPKPKRAAGQARRRPTPRSRSAARSSTSAAAQRRRQPRQHRRRTASRRAGGARGAVGAAPGARARRRHPPGARAAARRPDQRRRRAGVRRKRADDRRRAAGAAAAGRCPTSRKWGEVERKPMSNIRRKTAEHLGHAWHVDPARHAARQGRHHRARSAAQAVRPAGREGRRQADDDGDRAEDRRRGAAAGSRSSTRRSTWRATRSSTRSRFTSASPSTPSAGLLVPVIRDVDRKGIFELAAELAKASEKARAGKLSLDEMQGGGFTITNLGGIGGTSFTPIVNWPEVAILGISRGAQEPVWQRRRPFEPRLMLPLSLSYDHRVIDGADAARFLRWVADAFEQPSSLCGGSVLRPMPHDRHPMPSTTQLSSSAPAPAATRPRSTRPTSGCRSRWSIPRQNPGGVCLYRGCIPSKALLHVAEVVNEAKHADAWGITFGAPKIDLDRLRGFKTKVVTQLTGGLGQLSQAAQDHLRPGHRGVPRRAHPGDHHRRTASSETLTFEHAIIATGSHPAKVPGLSIDSPRRDGLDRRRSICPTSRSRCSSSAAATSGSSWARSTPRSARRSPSSR